ncbi:hypothetical protein MNBD_NITROSPINAE02-1107 [hydrothermal vent metagenome]|uniref:Uncharacterized protein n=1 Tax=hydrothermal vent metagenome TaxID=652676 RepID=A0A3B1C8E0_9ZZZZ
MQFASFVSPDLFSPRIVLTGYLSTAILPIFNL